MSLTLNLYGEFELLRDGERVALPASRKTRALLAFLALTGRPHRRERLCDLFWDRTDDPRAALRWSLSKMRPLVNDEAGERLIADRERVSLSGVASRGAQHAEGPDASADQLVAALDAASGVPLDGLDLPDLPDYQAWLVGERSVLVRDRGQLAARLARHTDIPPDRALAFAELTVAADPYSADAARQLISILHRLGRGGDADTRERSFKTHFSEAGLSWSEPAVARPEPEDLLLRQTIRFCGTKDGVKLAWASVGQGPPLVKAANWLTHLEFDWSSTLDRGQLQAFAANHDVIRYDGRGNGLSDWDVPDISFDAMVADLETVIDAANVDRFPLLGFSQGAAVAIEYAARHPERVSCMILHGGFAAGWRTLGTPDVIAEREALQTLIKSYWGSDNENLRRLISSTFIPSATEDDLKWFNTFQRDATSPENAVRFIEAFGTIDVRHRLKDVAAPTLVTHSRGDQIVGMHEARELAADIPNSRFLGLDSDSHALMDREPAMAAFVDATLGFISEN